MKVVFITPYFSPKVGGLENYALQIALGLQYRGHQVLIITSNHMSSGQSHESVQGLDVYRLPTTLKLSNTPINLQWYWQIKKLLQKIHPDIVNVHMPVPFIADMGTLAAYDLKIPVVVTYQNDIFKDNAILKLVSWSYYKILGEQTLKLAKKIISTSQHYVDGSRYLKRHQSKIDIIPPGILHKEHSRSIFEKKNDYVIFVGQLDKTHRHKGLNYLIDAFKVLQEKKSTLQLLIVGEGDDKENFKQRVNELKLENKVTFAGRVSDDRLSELYADALCVSLPSVSAAEGFGMVILEAGLHMTPAIGSNIGGIPESIVANETGLLVEPRDVNGLVLAISRLERDLKLRSQLGLASYKRVVSQFLWSQQVEKTEQAFEEIIL